MIYTGPAIVCVGENMVIGEDGKLRMAPWSVPRNVVDEIAPSGGDGKLLETTARAMKLLIDKKVQWRNNTPVDHQVRILPTRRFKRWITSNPNAVEFRDRWTSALDLPAAVPVVSGIHNGRTGSAVDVGTNSVAEPGPGRFWHWWGTNSSEEWVGPVKPGQTLYVHYRCYVWTPPPFSDNANKNSPLHLAEAGYTRLQLQAFPEQGPLVSG
jgi:hypothetical protein